MMTIATDFAMIAGIAAGYWTFFKVFFKTDEEAELWDKKAAVTKKYHHSS